MLSHKQILHVIGADQVVPCQTMWLGTKGEHWNMEPLLRHSGPFRIPNLLDDELHDGS